VRSKFFTGTTFEWIRIFQNAVPIKRGTNRATVFCLALAIRHLYILNKSAEFSISRSTLEDFGLNRRSIKPYLKYFHESGLIRLELKESVSPRVTLLSLPPVPVRTKKEV
jgi:hypothetical protein